jgi:hypothetical protein
MALSDLFDEEFMKNYANSKVDLGTTLLLEIKSFNINHRKFAIIMAEADDTVAMLIINSEINPNVFPSTYLQSQHVEIPVAGHEDFLDYNSFIDCTKFHLKPRQEVVDFISSNPQDVYNVTDEVCRSIVNMVTHSRLITPAEKRKFGFL